MVIVRKLILMIYRLYSNFASCLKMSYIFLYPFLVQYLIRNRVFHLVIPTLYSPLICNCSSVCLCLLWSWHFRVQLSSIYYNICSDIFTDVMCDKNMRSILGNTIYVNTGSVLKRLAFLVVRPIFMKIF